MRADGVMGGGQRGNCDIFFKLRAFSHDYLLIRALLHQQLFSHTKKMWFEGAQFIYLLNYDFYVGLQFPELIKKVMKKICFCRDLEDCGGVEVVCGFLTSIPCTQTKVKKKKFLLKK